MISKKVFWPVFCIALSLVSPFFSPRLLADIQSSHGIKGSSGTNAQKSKLRPVLPPRILAPREPVTVKRGGSVDVTVAMPSRMGAILEIRILDHPFHGELVRTDSARGEAVRYRYIHHFDSGEPEDAFSLLVRDPIINDSGAKVKVRILVSNPRSGLTVDPEGCIDFGKVPLGSTASREVTISNRYGSLVEGALTVSPPWKITQNPLIRLAEGESRTIQLQFDPQTTGFESCSLGMVDSAVNFPKITLQGEGTASFVILGNQRISLSGEHSEAVIALSNCLASELPVTLTGIPSMVMGNPLINLPPHGTGTFTLSVAGVKFAPDFLEKSRIVASAAAFQQPIDLQVNGPKAQPTLELLHGGGCLGIKVGETIRLEGIVRNPSDNPRTVEIGFMESGRTNNPTFNGVTLPPKGVADVHYDWTSIIPGKHEILVELRENGGGLDRQSWKLFVNPVANITPTHPPESKEQRLPSSETRAETVFRSATKDEKEIVAYQDAPILEKGFFSNHLLIRWRFLGDASKGFVLETPRSQNKITERSDVEEQNLWKSVEGVTPYFSRGYWNARIPMPWPGIHQYRVYPAGRTDVMVSTLSVKVDKWMFFWPMTRCLLLAAMMLLLWRFLRARI